jgi:predicted nucleotidyltransferase
MPDDRKSLDAMLAALQERAKELNCLYRVEDILGRKGVQIEEALREVVGVVPPGWQHPEVCQARIAYDGTVYETPGHVETPWVQSAPILVHEKPVGEIAVSYTRETRAADDGPFLKEEGRLLATLADRIGQFLQRKRERRRAPHRESPDRSLPASGGQAWTVILDFLRQSNRALLLRITRKMINHLCGCGVAEAQDLLRDFAPSYGERDGDALNENRPSARRRMMEVEPLIDRTFGIAARNLSEQDIIRRIQYWINEEKTARLASVLERLDTSLGDVSAELARYASLDVDEDQLPVATKSELRVALLRRFFTDRLDFLNSAKNHVRVADFEDLAHRVVAPPASRGKLGGKSAGLFVAMKIAREAGAGRELLRNVRTPRTWYVSSDALLDFIRFNELDDLYNRKYQAIDQVRQDYPHIVQLFKNSRFSPEITKGLSVALDDFEDRPLIVRSSSLLEDSSGAAFSGKYKSLFLANRGSKRERLEALQDAIAEVYASVFAPDPIEYRAERGLLDVHEEMAIMIQEVVGRRVSGYFLPSFSGVAFSNNEFRWSPRIRSSDGLVRLVPGLGTRAVDRLSDDYPVLIAPGQPNLRVNATPDEIVRYSPRKADVINLESRSFETVEFDELLRAVGREYPAAHRVVSRWKEGRLSRPLAIGADFRADHHVVTFEGLLAETPFLATIRELLEVLTGELGYPVDLEFAADGEDLYLLQCRAQSYAPEAAPAAIPRDVPRGDILFTARRHISNGRVTNLSHIVYVDPAGYDALAERDELLRVGRAVGQLNRVLPKRRFLLMGPGRWGSRGDVKLGVNVTYSDISNTAVLSEVARQKGGYSPDLSFGTHFFQDLVEAGIRYLPLYPDEEGNVYEERFLTRSPNLLAELLPEFADLTGVVRVIDVTQATGGRLLHVLMNAELDEALGLFAESTREQEARGEVTRAVEPASDEHWRWREFMVERIAQSLDRDRFGVVQLYVFGSTKNGTAGPGSDIDLLVHVRGGDGQRGELDLWLDGWSRCLSEMNYLRTGYRTDGLLDVHVITDEDIAKKTSFAVKIGAVTDAAAPLLPESG